MDKANGILPEGWKWVKLGEICKEKEGLRRGPFGSAIKKEFFVPVGYKVYEQSNAIYDDAFRGKYFISEDKYKELKNFEVQSGDLIVSCSGTLGRISEIPNNAPKGVINQALLRVRLKEEVISKKYFLYNFRSANFQRNIFDQSQGTAMTNLIGIKDFKEVTIPLPPLSIQAYIVEKLEAVLSELDKGKAQLLIAQAQLKTYRQAVLKYAFEGKLTGGTEGWEWVKTGEIMQTINNGYTPKSHFLSDGNGEIPFIKVYNLNFDGTLNFTKNPTFIPKEIHDKELKRSICYPNDVLINIVGPPLGKVSVITNQYPEWNINQAIVLFRPNEKIKPKFLAYFLQNPNTTNWLEGTSKATAGQWNVKVSTCREIPLQLPPLSTQEKIVTEIESRLSVCDKLEETLKVSLAQCETLRQSVLKRAFEGLLV